MKVILLFTDFQSPHSRNSPYYELRCLWELQVLVKEMVNAKERVEWNKMIISDTLFNLLPSL